MDEKSNLPLWIAGIGVVLCGTLLVAGVWLAFHTRNTTDLPPDANQHLPVLWHAPEFSFPDQHGKTTTDKDLVGKVWIADFMFTQCTTACPLLTAKLVLLQRRIDNPDVRFVSFSVDPEHDTEQALHDYAAQWNANEQRWILLRTQPESLKKLASDMHVLVQKEDDPDNPILHSATFFLIDANGDLRGAYSSNDDQDLDKLIADVNELANGESAQAVTADASGAEIYRGLGCGSCHENAKVAPYLGGLPGRMVMYNKGKMTTADDAYLRESILDPSAKIVDGYLELMPAYRPYLNDQQLTRLVQYLHALKPKAAEAAARIEKDPVCGMKVRVVEGTPQASVDGKTYYFCSEHCREEFEKDPDLYID